MLWIVQGNMSSEKAVAELLVLLKRYEIPLETVKVVPFGGGIEPDLEVTGPAVVVGSVSLARHDIKTPFAHGARRGLKRASVESALNQPMLDWRTAESAAEDLLRAFPRVAGGLHSARCRGLLDHWRGLQARAGGGVPSRRLLDPLNIEPALLPHLFSASSSIRATC